MLLLDDLGAIAQLVEQQVETLCVGGSIPPCAMTLWCINRTGTLSDTKIRYELDTRQVTMKFVSKNYNSIATWGYGRVTIPIHQAMWYKSAREDS